MEGTAPNIVEGYPTKKSRDLWQLIWEALGIHTNDGIDTTTLGSMAERVGLSRRGYRPLLDKAVSYRWVRFRRPNGVEHSTTRYYATARCVEYERRLREFQ